MPNRYDERAIGVTMRITAYSLDGDVGPEAELRQDDQAQLWLDDQVVLAVNLWGRKVALTLLKRLVLIAPDDYWIFIKYKTLSD